MKSDHVTLEPCEHGCYVFCATCNADEEDRLRDENERLRKALERIADDARYKSYDTADCTFKALQENRDIARRALGDNGSLSK